MNLKKILSIDLAILTGSQNAFDAFWERGGVAKNIEALDGQMIAEILGSSDNNQLRIIVKSYHEIAHDDPAISSDMLQDLLRGVASKVVRVSIKGTRSDWTLQFMSVAGIPRPHR